jgi:N-acetylneuraminic acid mutarotase
MKKIDKNNEGQLLLMTGVILTFTLITMASISVSIADIGLRTSSEQIQQLLFEFDNINTTFWRAYETELNVAVKGSSGVIDKTTVEYIFNKTAARITDIEELRGIRFAATISNINIETSKQYSSTSGGLGIPQNITSYGIIGPDGAISSWGATSSLPYNLYQSAVATNQDMFYLIGGRNDTSTHNEVYYSKRSVDGSLTSWIQTTSLPFPRAGHVAVTDKANSRAYVLGGFYGAIPQSTVYYANLTSSGVGNWTETLRLPISLHKHSGVIYGNRTYVIGGEDGTYQAVSTVYSCEIATNGSINSWRNESSIPSARKSHSAAICVVDGTPYIYVTGGIDSNGMVTNTVYYTNINTVNGTLNQWSESPATLLESVYSHGSMVEGNRLYLIGGRSASTITSKKVALTKISAGGNIDGWSNTTSLSNAPAEVSSWSYDGVLYATGGRDNLGVTSTSFREFYASSKIDYKFTLSDEKSTIKCSSNYTSSAI